MATQPQRETMGQAEPTVVMRAVEAPATTTVCGDCRYHVPRATAQGSWCGLSTAQRFAREVQTGQRACADFESWPEGSPVPAFLAAMRF